jgi:hypothetical protein
MTGSRFNSAVDDIGTKRQSQRPENVVCRGLSIPFADGISKMIFDRFREQARFNCGGFRHPKKSPESSRKIIDTISAEA